MKNKPVKDSQVVMHQMVLPNDANVIGNVLGGRVMHLMDICAAMTAVKHARKQVVTASIDRMDFLAPSKVGDILILKSSVNFCGDTSMEVGVRIHSEDRLTGVVNHTATAYLTFVAIDKKGDSIQIPQVIPETLEEKRRFNEGTERYIRRKKRRNES